MDIKRIHAFLKEIAAHNDRSWFQAHKNEYEVCRKDFEDGVGKAIVAISVFDDSIASLTPKDCCYRFYRDIRFSPDKSPYKRHFGAYICAHGKKSLMGGYYIHVEPGNDLLSAGAYYLPTNILTSCRNEIMSNISDWRKCVENRKFVGLFGKANATTWEEGKIGFGIEHLKTCPVGFPRDYEFIDYLKMKDYACWHRVADDFYEGDGWINSSVDVFKTAKPIIEFINNVISDYE